MTSHGKILCACGCGRSFSLPPTAPHKRFFSAECRNRWWARQLTADRQALRAIREGQQPAESKEPKA